MLTFNWNKLVDCELLIGHGVSAIFLYVFLNQASLKDVAR